MQNPIRPSICIQKNHPNNKRLRENTFTILDEFIINIWNKEHYLFEICFAYNVVTIINLYILQIILDAKVLDLVKLNN